MEGDGGARWSAGGGLRGPVALAASPPPVPPLLAPLRRL
jgi:hypothetical protein